MAETLLSVIIVVLSLYLTIFVHEWGHYLVARKLKVPLKSVNIGIGPILLSHKLKGEMPLNIRLMPIGGFLEIESMAFFKKTELSAWHRCCIALAGPANNLALCFYLAVILWVSGIPLYSSSTVVGFSDPDIPTGVQPGDKVLDVGGRPIRNWNQLRAAAFSSATTNLQITVARGESKLKFTVPVILRRIGIPMLPISPTQPLFYRPEPLRKQEILSINGNPYYNGDILRRAAHSNQTLVVTYRENGKTQTATWKPTERMLLGVWEDKPVIVRANPVTILVGTTRQIGVSLWEIVRPHTNVGVFNLSGPLTTMLWLHRFYDTDLRLGLFLVLALNLNLCLFNLLPLFPLDGSHLVYALLQKTKYLKTYQMAMYAFSWVILMSLSFLLFIDILKFSTL